jgi:hypothetical protein
VAKERSGIRDGLMILSRVSLQAQPARISAQHKAKNTTGIIQRFSFLIALLITLQKYH